MTTMTATAPVAYTTRNDLAEDTRSLLIDMLNRLLADAVDLATQVKVAHWNVKGPTFMALHELFDDVHADIQEYSDLLAERAVQLGGIAAGTARTAGNLSELDEYPMRVMTGTAHVEAVADRLAAFGARTRSAIDEADRFGDQATADLFTEITRGVDKWLWFVEAHTQER